MKRSLLIVAWLVLKGIALAVTSRELLDQLQGEVREYASKKPAGEERVSNSMQQFAMMLARVDPDGDGNGGENLGQIVDQLVLTAPTDKIREIAKVLGPQLKEEQEAREEEYANEITKTVGEALRKCLTAKLAKEMDEPLAITSKLVRNSNRSYRNQRLVKLQQQGQQAFELMRQLQNLVAGVGREDGGDRRQIWQSLMVSQTDFAEFMPRSELLEKITELRKQAGEAPDVRSMNQEEWNENANGRLAKVKTLEELSEVLAALQTMKSNQSYFPMNQLIQEVQPINASYQELKRGQASTISLNSFSGRSGSNLALLDSLRAQLVAFALPRLLQQAEAEPKSADDNLVTYFQRVLEKAKSKRDWGLVGRVITVAQQLNVQIGSGNTDTQALNSLLSGINFERARVYPAAVNAYLATLKTGSQVIPADYIGDLLAAIKKEHQAEYELGEQIPLDSPQISQDAMMRARMGLPGYYGNGRGFPGSGEASAAAQRLTVPAANPAKAPDKAVETKVPSTPPTVAPAAPLPPPAAP